MKVIVNINEKSIKIWNKLYELTIFSPSKEIHVLWLLFYISALCFSFYVHIFKKNSFEPGFWSVLSRNVIFALGLFKHYYNYYADKGIQLKF